MCTSYVCTYNTITVSGTIVLMYTCMYMHLYGILEALQQLQVGRGHGTKCIQLQFLSDPCNELLHSLKEDGHVPQAHFQLVLSVLEFPLHC